MIRISACVGGLVAGIGLLASQLASANPADLDWTFAGGGIAQTALGPGGSFVPDALLQRDGKIVGVNYVYPYENQDPFMALVRYNADGSRDQMFGINGVVRSVPMFGTYVPSSIALEPDGDIVVAGRQDAPERMLLIRYEGETGQLDSEFGDQGVVTTQFGATQRIARIVTLPDGSIVATASASGMNAFLIKYTADGVIDTTFGEQGIAPAPQNFVNHLVLMDDGRFLVAGTVSVSPGEGNPAVARMNEDGSIDTTYGVDGMATIDMQGNDDFDGALAMQADGSAALLVGQNIAPASVIVARLGADGSLDRSFGTDGFAQTSIGTTDEMSSLCFQPDGKILVAGSNDQYPGFMLVRYTSNGALDETFGDGGISIVGSTGSASNVLMQPDGKIVEAGSNAPDNGFKVARYVGTPEAIFADGFDP